MQFPEGLENTPFRRLGPAKLRLPTGQRQESPEGLENTPFNPSKA